MLIHSQFHAAIALGPSKKFVHLQLLPRGWKHYVARSFVDTPEDPLGELDPKTGQPWKGFEGICLVSVRKKKGVVQGLMSVPDKGLAIVRHDISGMLKLKNLYGYRWDPETKTKRRVNIPIKSQRSHSLKLSESGGISPSLSTVKQTENKMKKKSPATPALAKVSNPGTATFFDHGFIVINSTGALETKASPVVIPGCTSANIRSMQQAKAAFAMEFAKRSELSTDDSSPDDAKDNGGRAVFVDLGFDVVNDNGALETHVGSTIIPGCTSGNIKSMTEAKAAFAMEFANHSELSTDESSADDAK